MPKKIEFEVKAIDNASVVFEKERKALEALHKEAERRVQIGTVGRLGEDLEKAKKSATGKGLEQLTSLAKGGGIAAAVAFGFSEIAQGAEKAATAITSYRKGLISAEEEHLQLLESLPLVGRVVSGTKSIADFVLALVTPQGVDSAAIAARDALLKQQEDAAKGLSIAISQSQGESQSILRTVGASGLSQLREQLDQDTDAKFQRVLDLSKKRLDPNLKSEDLPELNKAHSLASDAYQKTRIDNERKFREAVRQVEEDGVRRVADVTSQARVLELKSLGKDLDAESELIRNATERNLETSKRYYRLLLDVEKDPDRHKVLEDQQRDEQAAIKRTGIVQQNVADAAERDRRTAIADTRFGLSQSLLSFRRSQLGLAGQLGDVDSDIAGRKLDVTEAIRARQAELGKIIGNEHATFAQRAAAFLDIQALPLQEKIEKQLIDSPIFRGRTAPNSNSLFTNGASQAASERVYIDPRLAQALKELKDGQSQTADKMISGIVSGVRDLLAGIPALKDVFNLN